MVSTSVVQDFFVERKVVTPASLKAEVSLYRSNASQTMDRLNAYVFDVYGIEGFGEIVEDWWTQQNRLYDSDGVKPISSDVTTICLARQLLSWSSEQLSFAALGEKLKKTVGFDWRICPYVGDCYGRHHYKTSLIKVPELRFDAKGALIGIQYVPVIKSKKNRAMLLEGKTSPILRCITTDEGMFWKQAMKHMDLPLFHQFFWKRVTNALPQCAQDISGFHSLLLYKCMESTSDGKPTYFFLEQNGRAVKVDASVWASLTEEQKVTARPPARWYYFFYLSLFTTGARVLCASLDDDEDVHAMFAVMSHVESVTGCMPLITAIPYKHETPSCTLYFNEVNSTLIGTQRWNALLEQELPTDQLLYDTMFAHERALSTRATT